MLFKYVRGGTGAEALQVLKCFCEQHTLKTSQPTLFNDPFEFKIAIDFDADEETMRKRFFQDKPGASQAEYTEWRREHTTQSKWWINQQTRSELLSRFGVLCLSAVEDNHLMWSHYASDHQGFCVGLDETQLNDMKGVVGYGFVDYQETAPSFRYYFDPPELFEKRVFGCKSLLWSYEREYRIVFDGSGIMEFPRAALKQVILGSRAYRELRAYAQEHCVVDSAGFFQMCEDFQAYRLIKQPIVKNTGLMSSFF